VGKSGMLEHKSGNISETRKDIGKDTMEAYRNSPTLFRTVAPRPLRAYAYGLLFPKIGSLQPPPKTSIDIISGTGEAADFKFRQYIQGVDSNKSPLEI